MELQCPKCKSTLILKRIAVPRIKPELRPFIEPKFYCCVKCNHEFNVK